MILVYKQEPTAHHERDFPLNLPGLSPVEGKELCARFDGGRLSSDGGVWLFPGIERRLGIADLLASCVTDERTPREHDPHLRRHDPGADVCHRLRL